MSKDISSWKHCTKRRNVLGFSKRAGLEILEGDEHTKIRNPKNGEHTSCPRHDPISTGVAISIFKTLCKWGLISTLFGVGIFSIKGIIFFGGAALALLK